MAYVCEEYAQNKNMFDWKHQGRDCLPCKIIEDLEKNILPVEIAPETCNCTCHFCSKHCQNK